MSFHINFIALVDYFISKCPCTNMYSSYCLLLCQGRFSFFQLHVRCPEKQEAKTKYVADCPSDDLFVAYRNNSITIFSKSP